MKILVTSDPHDSLTDEQFPNMAQSRGCDLGVIAGDFLNLFLEDPSPVNQGEEAIARLLALSQIVPVAACSGNHDVLDLFGAGWLVLGAGDAAEGRLTVDGQHAVLDGLVVSVVGYWDIWTPAANAREHNDLMRRLAEETWREGRRLADLDGLPWMVVHHEPPQQTRVNPVETVLLEDTATGPLHGWCRYWVERYEPEFIISGHVHEAPVTGGGTWCDRVGGTWCFNPGRFGKPGYGDRSGIIELDTIERTARWFPPYGNAEGFVIELETSTESVAQAA